MRRSFRLVKKSEPYGRLVIEIFKNLIQLMNRPGSKFLHDIHEMTKAALNVEIKKEEVNGPLLSKQQFIAIVGVMKTTDKACYAAARKLGFNENDIRFFNEIDSYKNGGYTDKLLSSHCVAVILGGAPHNSSGDIESKIQKKLYYARSGSQGKLKLTGNNIDLCLKRIKKDLQLALAEEAAAV